MLPLPLFGYVVLYSCFACNVFSSTLKKFDDKAMELIDEGSDAIHCYCNLPPCITTSYMCKSKSAESGCFKKIELATEHISYGCLDLIMKNQRCSDSSSRTTNSSSSVEFPSTFECCFSDMCNELVDQNAVRSNDIQINEPDEQKRKELLLENFDNSSSFSYYTNTEIWFRALLIAVPICGLMVLVILIFIAVKMLKSDLPQNSRFTSAHLRKKFNGSDVNDKKIKPRVENGFKSHLLPKYDKLEKKWSIVFKPQQEKNCDSKYFRHSSCHNDRKSSCDNFEHAVHAKFAKQNLSILKLPYKFNEFKSKNNFIYKNVNLNRKNCDGSRNFNDCSVVTVDSNVSYSDYSLINNFIR